ncbi:hypothetical protein FQR65_LT10539 [Abscondita terminalis]|nr:hypothetical protein FQR65_LT10539 [Abscondita terminalis]
MKQLLVFILCVVGSYALPTRVVNGTAAEVGEIPWIVSLRSYGYHICGGSILDANHILTASHCVEGSASGMSIQYGVIDKSSDSYNSIDIVKITQHEDYTGYYPYHNDVAVLKTASPIPLGDLASPVTLPEQDEQPISNSVSLLAGWGSTGVTFFYHCNELQKVELKVYSHEDCVKAHGGAISIVSHLCSGVPEGWKGQCSGDSGGPLVSGGKQIGSVSWSVKPCAIVGYPGAINYQTLSNESSSLKTNTTMKQLLILVLCVAATYALPTRVVNGTPAAVGEIPYIVSLRSYGFHICGGSILDATHVLTASHCVTGSTSGMSIQYGIIDISDDSFNSINVKKIIQHEEYTGAFPYHNDVAVLLLESEIPLGELASPVTLPAQDEQPISNSVSLLAGWGSTGITSPTRLQKVELKVYSHEDCVKAHGSDISIVSHLCSGVPEGWKGQCSGDSGGPLVSGGKQIGSVSWSVKPCAIVGYPGVYAKTASYSDWIRLTMWLNK